MVKKLLLVIALLSLLAAALPAQAAAPPFQRLGTGVATSLAVSADGGTLAVGASIGVWFLAADTLEAYALWETGGWVHQVAYSADGRFLRADDQFYDVTLRQPVAIVPGDLTWQDHTCSAGGRYCAAARIGHVVVQDMDTLIHVALLQTGLVHDVAWSPDETTLYVVGGHVQSYAIPSGALQQTQPPFFTGGLGQVTWSNDGRRLASGGAIWDVSTGQVVGADFCADTTGAWDPRACAAPRLWMERWDVRVYLQSGDDPCAYRWIDPHDNWTDAASLSPDETLLATSGSDIYHYSCGNGRTCDQPVDQTRVWDAATFERIAQLNARYNALAFTPDAAILLGLNRDSLEAWNWRAGQRQWTAPLPGGYRWLAGLTISPDGRFAAAYNRGEDRSTVLVWRMDTGALAATLEGHTQPTAPSLSVSARWPFGVGISDLTFNPDSTRLAASSENGTVLIWSVASD